MQERVRVGIVVASWEDSRLTRACLDSLTKLALEDAELALDVRVVVCDDGSSPAVRDALAAVIDGLGDSRISFCSLARRSGYAAAVNLGVKALQPFQPDYVWLLNNDITVTPDALMALATSARARPGIQLWGSTIVEASRPDRLECAGGYRYSPLSTRNSASHGGRDIGELSLLEPQALDYIAGAAIFCPAAVMQAAGGLSEDYFLYFEEQDLVKRLPQPARLAWCRDSIVYHAGAATTGRGAMRSPLQQYYENYGTLTFTGRYYPGYLPMVLGARLLLKPLLFLFRREWWLYRPFTLALLDFLRRRGPRSYEP